MAVKDKINEEVELNNQLEVKDNEKSKSEGTSLFIEKEVSSNLISIKSKVPYLVYVKYGNDTIMLQPYSVVRNLNKNKIDKNSNEYIVLN